MGHEEFVKRYYQIAERALIMAQIVREKGFLELDKEIDHEKAEDRDILEYGLRFVIDGVDGEFIDRLLSNIIRQEKDEYAFTLKNIQKEAVMSIYWGWNPRMIYYLLNSYTDISLKDDEVRKRLEKCHGNVL